MIGSEDADEDDDSDGDDDVEYDSGPLCRHYDNPVNCTLKCKRCGHSCLFHPSWRSPEPDICEYKGCACGDFIDED